MNTKYLSVAIPKGRLGDQTIKQLNAIGFSQLNMNDSRKLIFEDDNQGVVFIAVKPIDVITYVQSGMADIGVVGKDLILEEEANIYELFDLNIGKCSLSIASLNHKVLNTQLSIRIATKYPNLTKKHFENKQKEVEIIPLNGSVELGPIVGLSDVIVDIVETGETLKANGLHVIEKIHDVSARLISNKASYRFKYKQIKSLLSLLEKRSLYDQNH